MSTSEFDSILTKVERLSTNDKKLLIKRVVDLLDETSGRPKTQRTLPVSRRRKTGVPSSKQRAALEEEIAAYALRHGGNTDNLDLDPALEAASVEYLRDAEETVR